MVKTSAKQFGNYFGHMTLQRQRQAEAEVQLLPRKVWTQCEEF